MHQNAPVPDKKNSGDGSQPLPRPLPYWGGDTPSLDPTLLGTFGAPILEPSAIGVPVPFHLRLVHCARATVIARKLQISVCQDTR